MPITAYGTDDFSGLYTGRTMTTTPPAVTGDRLFAFLCHVSVDPGTGSARGFAVGAGPSDWDLVGSVSFTSSGASGSTFNQIIIWSKIGTGSDTFSVTLTGTAPSGTGAPGVVCGSFSTTEVGTPIAQLGNRGKVVTLTMTPAYTVSIPTASEVVVLNTYYWSSAFTPPSTNPVLDPTDTSGFTLYRNNHGSGSLAYGIAEHGYTGATLAAPMPQWDLTTFAVGQYLSIVLTTAASAGGGGLRFGTAGLGSVLGLG